MSNAEEIEQMLMRNEKLVTRIAEVLALKRNLVLVAVLALVWGLFGFAYKTKAGFLASICLIISTVYILSIIYAYFHDKIEKIFFSELKDRTGVPTIKEIAAFISKLTCGGSSIHNIAQMTNSKRYMIAGVCIALAVVFKFVRPFWFNLIVVTAAILAYPVYTLIQGKKNASGPAPKQAPAEEKKVVAEEEAQPEKVQEAEPATGEQAEE